MFHKTWLAGAALCLAAVSANAQPQLRLRVPAPLTRPIWFTPGSNQPFAEGELFFNAFNVGDGALAVQATADFDPWINLTVAGPGACPFAPTRTCRRIVVEFQTAGLAPGDYQGSVAVTSPGAIDAPQTLPISIHVGTDVPDRIDLYVPPVDGATDSLDFETPQGPSPTFTQAGDFLTVSSSGLGSFRFLHTHRIAGRYRAGGAVADIDGSIDLIGSDFAADNRNVPITLHVTGGPIASLSAATMTIGAVTGVNPPDQLVVVSNRGQGDLALGGIDVATESGGAWLSAEDLGNGIVALRASVDGLALGAYRGTLTINANAANAPLVVVVVLFVRADAGPLSSFRGAVNGATFDGTTPLTPNLITSLFGSQFAGEVLQATTLPLPKEMAGIRVVIDGIEASLFFVSGGQINFQVPLELTTGEKFLQVFRNGAPGNRITVNIANRSAGVFLFGRGQYGAIANATQNNFPLPARFSAPGFNTAPARPGDAIVIFATGLGAVDALLTGGVAATAAPLINAIDIPLVNFGQLVFRAVGTPFFTGLAPGFVGLFQVNVIIPVNVADTDRVPLVLEYADGTMSNTVEIAVRR